MIERHHCISTKSGIPFMRDTEDLVFKTSGKWFVLKAGFWIECQDKLLIASAEIFDRFKYPT